MIKKDTILFLIRNNKFLLSLIAIHLVYLTIQIVNHNLYMVDSPEYLYQAKNIVSNWTFYSGDLQKEINIDLYTKRPPIYPLLIASVKLIFKSDLFLIILQSIISILSIQLIRKSFLQIGYNSKYDLISFLLLLLSPAQMVYANIVMAETLFQFFITLIFFFVVRFVNTNSNRYLVFVNLTIAISALTKPVMYLFVFPSLLVMLYISLKSKSLKPMMLGLMPIVIIQAFSFWNYKRTDYWHFSSIQTINLVQYNTYYFNVQRQGMETAELFLDNQIETAEGTKSYRDRVHFLKQTSIRVIKDNPIEYAWFHAKGMFRFFIDPGRFDLSNYLGLEEKGNVGFLNHLNNDGIRGAIKYLSQQDIFLILALILVGIINMLKLAGLALFTFEKRIDFRIRAFIVILIGYVAFATGPLGASRFAMPFIPIFIFSTSMILSKYFNTLKVH